MTLRADEVNWNKSGDGLVPAVVQHAHSGQVLMLGYMNQAAFELTLQSGQVTFFSRSKGRLWTKGETSGYHLRLESVHADCDADALLVLAEPAGPTCHRGTASCFEHATPALSLFADLEETIASRDHNRPAGSYTTTLFDAGVRRIAQKVGEEAVESALAAVAQDDEALIGETADLLYHVLVLLRARNIPLKVVLHELQKRRR